MAYLDDVGVLLTNNLLLNLLADILARGLQASLAATGSPTGDTSLPRNLTLGSEADLTTVLRALLFDLADLVLTLCRDGGVNPHVSLAL